MASVACGISRAFSSPGAAEYLRHAAKWSKRLQMMGATAVLGGILALTLPGTAPAHADVSFRDKSITMIVASAPGGGTDVSGRAIARFLSKYLPGSPPIVVQNMPGANGVT